MERNGVRASRGVFRGVVDQARSLHRPRLERAAQLWQARSLIGTGEHDDGEVERVAGPVARWAEPIPVDQHFDVLPPLPVTVLAEIRFAQGRFDEALGHVDQALAISLANGRAADEVLARELIVRILNATGRWREADALADELLPIAEGVEFRSILWQIYSDKAEALKNLGNEDAARSARKVGTELIHTTAHSIPDPKLREGFLASKAVVAAQTRREGKNE